MIKAVVGFLANLEAKLANYLGKRAEKRLKKKYPKGLEGTVSFILKTRGKISGSFSNIEVDGYYPSSLILQEFEDVYEVVYQAWLEPHRDFVLSLFEQHRDPELRNQVLWVGERIRILEYSCVVHPLHRFIIGSDVEVYPSKVVVLK